MADYSGQFGDFSEEERAAQVTNPAQPVGLSQLAANWNPEERAKNPFGPQDYAEASKEWFGGRNVPAFGAQDANGNPIDGTVNGWSTPFINELIEQQNLYLQKAAEANDRSLYYSWVDSPDATGLVLWNDPEKGLRAGDVFKQGVKQQNIYDVYANDKATADLLMSNFMFGAQEEERINATGAFGDGGAEVRAEKVAKFVEEQTVAAAGAKTAGAYQNRLELKKQEYNTSGYGVFGDESTAGSVAAGAGAGALTGATGGAVIGSVLPGPGTVVGGVIGGLAGTLVGAVGGWLNRDEITEAAAKGAVQAEMAGETEGRVAGITAAIQGAAGTAMLAGQPLANVTKGVTVEAGNRGDGIVDQYAIDPETGKPKMSGWQESLILTATLGDSFLQFFSPGGRALYMGTMGAYTGGKLATTVVSDSVFNQETATWDSLDSAKEYFGAYGSIGIDAVQMGMVGGFVGRTKSIQKAAGLSPKTEADAVTAAWKLLPGTKRAGSVADAGTTRPSEVVSGMRVWFDDAGKVVAARPSIQMLAPSEMFRSVVVGQQARRQALKVADGGAASWDDFYRAHVKLAYSSSRWQNSLTAGFAEAIEEGAQSLLDPLSYGGDFSGMQAVKAAAYGFASGAGMALGVQAHMGYGKNVKGKSDQQLVINQLARENTELRLGTSFTDDEWAEHTAQWSEETFLMQAMRDPSEIEDFQKMMNVAQGLQDYEVGMFNPIGVPIADGVSPESQGVASEGPAAFEQVKLFGAAAEYDFALDGTIIGFKPGVAADEIAFSWGQLAVRIERKLKMYEAHVKDAQAQIVTLKRDIERAQEAGETDVVTRLQQVLDSVELDMRDQQELAETIEIISNEVVASELEFHKETDLNVRSRMVDTMNEALRRAVIEGKWTLLNGSNLQVSNPELITRAVEQMWGREPLQDSGSVVRFIPKISLEMTQANAHGRGHVHQTMLKIVNGDHDGDALEDLSGVYLPPASRRAARLGRAFITGEDELTLRMDPPDAEVENLKQMRRMWNGPTEHNEFVKDELEVFSAWFKDRYATTFEDPAFVDAVLAEFIAGFTSGDATARTSLIKRLAAEDVAAFVMRGEQDGRLEIPNLSNEITLLIEKIKRKFALAEYTPRRDASVPAPAQVARGAQVSHDAAVEEAATAGAMLSLLFGADAQRASQKVHYNTFLRAAVSRSQTGEGGGESVGFVPAQAMELALAHMELSSGEVDTAQDKIDRRDEVTDRVLQWLGETVDNLYKTINVTPTPLEKNAMMLVVAQLEMPDYNITSDGGYSEQSAGSITLVQSFLRTSVQMARKRYEGLGADSDVNKRLNALMGLTYPQSEHSYSASSALLEIFGGMRLGDLLGDYHATLGPNMTVDQYVQELRSMDSYHRGQKLSLMKGIGYLKHHGLGDPPYQLGGPEGAATRMQNGTLNGFTVLVDAIAATSNTHYKALKDRNDRVTDQVGRAFASLQNMIDQWAVRFVDQISYPPNATEQDRRKAVLLDMMRNDPRLPELLAGLFPLESRQATFARDNRTGEIVAKAWVLEALTTQDIDRALVIYYVNTQLDQYQQLGAKVAYDERKKAVTSDAKATADGVPFNKIKSRFLQRLHTAVMVQPGDGGASLDALFQAMFSAKNLQELQDVFNDNPILGNGREKLLLWYDNVSDFETVPTDMFGGAMPGAVMRERFEKITNRLQVLSQSMVDERASAVKAKAAIDAMKARLAELGGTDADITNLSTRNRQMPEVDKHLTWLLRAIEHRRNIPDIKGMNVYDQAFAAAQRALITMQDKGKAAAELENVGTAAFANTTWGWRIGLEHNADSITAVHWEQILANLSKLTEGPVRVQYDDGSVSPIIDLSTAAGALEALSNEATQMFARAVLLPTGLDLDANNNLQIISQVDDPFDFVKALEQDDFAHIQGIGSNSIQEAYTFFGLVESAMQGQALNDTAQVRAAATHKLHHLMNDFITVYMHSADKDTRGDARTRHRLVADLMDSLQRIAWVEDPALQQEILVELRSKLAERAHGRNELDQLRRDDPALYRFLEDALEQQADEALAVELERLAAQMDLVPAGSKAYDELRQKRIDLIEASKGSVENVLRALAPSSSAITVENALRRFTVDTTDEESKAASIADLLGYLDSGDVLMRMLAKDTTGVVEQARVLIGQMAQGQLDPTEVADTDWQKLSAIAATELVAQSLSPTGSWVGLTPIDPNDAIQTSYYDYTFTYLADRLFDPQLMEAVRYVTAPAKQRFETTANTVDQTTRYLLDHLFHEDRLGQWTTRIPVESTKLRKAVDGSVVGAALSTPGSIPVRLGPYSDISTVTFELPEEHHHSVFTLDGDRSTDVLAALFETDIATRKNRVSEFVKLEHHFIRSVKLVSPDLAGEEDITLWASLAPYLEDAVEQSGYRVLTFRQLQAGLNRFLEQNPQVQTYTLAVDYVDVDKKPATNEYATSVYFEGVGREFEANAMLSPINSMLFSSNGLNQTLQQIPLDFMKSGSAFAAYRTDPFARLVEMEAEAETLAELMHLKAMHLLYGNYEGGRLQYGDLPALHKMMKLRHLARAADGTVLWIEQAIAAQEAAIAAGEAAPTFELIPLSDPIAKRLFQLAESDIQARPGLGHGYPALDAETLSRIGLDGIGEQRELDETPFATVGLPRATFLSDRKGAPVRQTNDTPIKVAEPKLMRAEFARRLLRTTGEYTPARITTRNNALIKDSVAVESILPNAVNTVVQSLHAGKIAEDVQSEYLASQIEQLKPNVLNMTFVLTGDKAMSDTFGVSTGYITPLDLMEGMGDTSAESATVTYGDVVAIDLVAIYENMFNRNNEGALRYIESAIKILSERGVSFVLMSDGGSSRQLRGEVAAFINELPSYRSVAGNSTFFTPITERNYLGATLQSERSTLTSTFSRTAESVDLMVISDDQDLNEGSIMVFADRMARQARHVNVLLPTQYTISNPDLNPLAPSGDAYAFGLPPTGAAFQMVNERLSAYLRSIINSPDGRKLLADLARGDKSSPDPEGYSIYTEYPNGGYKPGIRSFDDALTVLLDHLHPSDPLVGRRLMLGDIIPVVDNRGNVVLLRYGFDFPAESFQSQFSNMKMQDGLQTVAGMPGDFTLAVAAPSVNTQQTTYSPFEVREVRWSKRGAEVRGSYPLGLGKMTSLFEGVKTAPFDAPSHIKPVDVPISRQAGNAISIIGEIGRTSQIGKGATRQNVDNMRNAFAVFGIGFQEPLRQFFFGDNSELSEAKQDDLIKDFLREWSFANVKMTRDQVSALITERQLLESVRATLEPLLSMAFSELSYDSLIAVEKNTLGQDEDVPARIAMLLMSTLALPGVTYEDVIGSLGFLNAESQGSKERIKFMPSILTEALNDGSYPKTRAWLFEQMDRNVNRAEDGTRVYILDDNWDFYYLVTDADGNNPVYRKGTLTFGKYEQNEESPEVNANSQGSRSTQQISPHQMNVINKISNGGRTPVNPDRLVAEGIVIEDLATEWLTREHLQSVSELAPMYGLLPQIKRVDASFNNYLGRTYLEQRVAERANARMELYLQLVPYMTDDKPWDMTEIQPMADAIIRKLNLTNEPAAANRQMLDTLVRQFLGSPGPSADQGDDVPQITAKQYKEALSFIQDNINAGYNPLHKGAVPLPHAHLFLQRVFNAQVGKAEPWYPVGTSSEKDGDVGVADWADWVSAIIGQAKNSHADFETMFSSDLNGFWQSYTGVAPSTMSHKLTPNDLVNAQLASPNKEEAFADMGARWDEISLTLSLDPTELALMKSPIILESMDLTIESMLGKDQVFSGTDAPNVLASATFAKQRRERGWRARKRLSQPSKPAMVDFVSEGRNMTHPMAQGTVLGRNLVNISIINRLLNPAIWVSGLIEVPVLAGIQNVSNILTGQYLGFGGVTLAAAGEKVGLKPRYTPQQVEALKRLAAQIAEDPAWRTEVMRELNYRVEIAKGDPTSNGVVTQRLERAAEWTARVFSDPRQGSRAPVYAEQYLQGVLDYINQTNRNIINVDQLIAVMSRDPLAIKKKMGDGVVAHQMGLNHMSQIRGTKPTLLGESIMAPIHWLIARDSAAFNFAGHLLQIPFAFTSFNAGRLLTLTGMQGWDQLIATFFDARRRPAFLSKKAGEVWDNSEIIETLDLQNTFIRSGATLTMLMALGLQAGRLGLGGESEEEERRRRLAKYLNVPHYLDPREPANSFLYADAVFLKEIPFLNNMFQNDAGNYAVVPHWIIRQFSSPIMGMQRFFQTGDLREIRYGFEDAYSALPNSFERIVFQGDQLATQLALEAQRQAAIAAGTEAELGSPREQSARERTYTLLVSTVGVLERALIENQFVNNLYTAMDKYDRNAYQYAATNDEATDGLDRTQGTNLPQRSDARTAVRGPDGEVFEPYLNRTGADGALHNYTKSNFTAATLASLFTGQGFSGSYNRKNMVPKEVVIERQDLNMDEAKALIHAAYAGQGGEFKLTETEIVRVLKAQWEATTDERWDQAELEARAKVIYDANNGATALSEITKDGQEAFTKYGNIAVIRGLWKGSVELGSPALQGFALTQEQRDAIKVEMLTEIKQDAINLGLGTEAANYVMYRVWNGDDTTGVVGLKDIIYSDGIPATNKLRYNQLNVTYALGPDGRPWATPFTRETALGALGIPIPRQMWPAAPGTKLDKLGNVIDSVAGINTGLAALERKQEPELEITDPDELTDQVAAKTLTPDKSPYVNRKKYGGYGGGGGSYGRPFYSRMDRLPGTTSARVDDVSFINTNSPYVRRSRINRERVFGERGRLNEWQ